MMNYEEFKEKFAEDFKTNLEANQPKFDNNWFVYKARLDEWLANECDEY